MDKTNKVKQHITGHARELCETICEALETFQLEKEDRILFEQFIREEIGESC